MPSLPDFNDAVLKHARKDFPLLQAGMTVQAALEKIRREGVAERVIYFYAVDGEGRLVGVLPTRRLLTSSLHEQVDQIMIRRVIALPNSATVLEACEFFVLYKFLAFPVVDQERRVVGMIDVSLFAEELLAAGDEQPHADEIFEAVGFRLAQIRGASPWRVFRYRFPWLLVTVAAGTACAILAGAFETTLSSSLVITFFLTMVLGLNESVSMQSMAVTIQALRSTKVDRAWFLQALTRELANAALLGSATGMIVAVVVWLWKNDPIAAFCVGSTVAISLVTAAVFGLSVPSLLHRLKLDPKIAAGPVALGLTDLAALGFYFTIASIVLK
jgi:Mg/Co/Ni transporter MgtE (contains CBS domain)